MYTSIYVALYCFLLTSTYFKEESVRSVGIELSNITGFKETWPHPSFFWYGTDFSEFNSADIIDNILEKSVLCQKKDGRGHACHSFFWYDNDKDLNVCFLVTRVILFACTAVKDKSLVLEELEQLRTVQTELTQQVADLTTELEKERSKVHSLQSELEKQQRPKVGIFFSVFFF